jgi:hypothetical protein
MEALGRMAIGALSRHTGTNIETIRLSRSRTPSAGRG